MKKIICLLSYLMLLNLSSKAINITINGGQYDCSQSQLNLTTDFDPTFYGGQSVSFNWIFGGIDPTTNQYFYIDTITENPSITLNNYINVDFIQLAVINSNNVALDYGSIALNSFSPQIYIYAGENNTCQQPCELDFTLQLYNNSIGGTIYISNGDSIPVEAYVSYITLPNVCPFSTVTFVTNNNCSSNSVQVPHVPTYVNVFENFGLDPSVGSCNGIVNFNYQGCIPLDSINITTSGTFNNVNIESYTITASDSSSGIISINSLCEGNYVLHIYSGGSINQTIYFDVASNGYNNAFFSNLQTLPSTNFECNGSMSFTVQTNEYPYWLKIYSYYPTIFDSVFVETPFYSYNRLGVCPGSYTAISYNPTAAYQNYLSINVENTITYQMSIATTNASSCGINDGSITLTYDFPSNLRIVTSSNEGFYNYYNASFLEADGQMTISNFSEGNQFVQIFDDIFNTYYFQSFNIGVDNANLNNNYVSSILQNPGCSACIGKVQVTLDSTYLGSIYTPLFYANNPTFIENTLVIDNLCQGVNSIPLYSNYNSLVCSDTLVITLDSIASGTQALSTNSIVPAACNTFDSMDGQILVNSTNLYNLNYKWFQAPYLYYPISDSLNIFNLNSGPYTLIAYNSSNCNTLNVEVPFTDSCGSYYVSVNKDFNANCQYDDYGYYQKQILINPGSMLVNSFSYFSLPYGNYVASPTDNLDNYCNDSINFISSSNYWFDYSTLAFNDSSTTSDLELFAFPGQAAELFGATMYATITNNSNDSISTVLKFNSFNFLDNYNVGLFFDNVYENSIPFYTSNDSIYVPLNISGKKQYFLYITASSSSNIAAGNYPLEFSFDYNDANTANNQTNTSLTVYETFVGRSQNANDVMVTKTVNNNGFINDISQELVYSFTILNNSQNVINSFMIKDQLDSEFDLNSISYLRELNTNYGIKNNVLYIKAMEQNILPGEMKTIHYKVNLNSATSNGSIIFGEASFSYNHYSYQTIMPESITVDLKESKSINSVNSLLVFPNPTDGLVNVMVTKTGGDLKVYDVLGTLVKSNLNITENNKSISIENLSKGIYTIEYNNFGEVYRSKVVKR